MWFLAILYLTFLTFHHPEESLTPTFITKLKFEELNCFWSKSMPMNKFQSDWLPLFFLECLWKMWWEVGWKSLRYGKICGNYGWIGRILFYVKMINCKLNELLFVKNVNVLWFQKQCQSLNEWSQFFQAFLNQATEVDLRLHLYQEVSVILLTRKWLLLLVHQGRN